MTNSAPRLNIGLPVYNGADYIEQTLISLQNQTFTDYKLIISDNASTDRTEEICREYAARDARICYYRNEKNIGATQNWYRVFDLSSSEYFASVAHDDIYDPEYMRKCIEILEQKPDAILCYSRTDAIDGRGDFMGTVDITVDTTSPKSHKRLYNVIAIDYLCIQLYGVMRSSALKRTKVFQGYYGCDRNTLAELTLLGALYEIPEYLFHHRLYENALGIAMGSGKSIEELNILDPGTDWRYRDTFKTIYTTYYKSVSRLIDSPVDRFLCYQALTSLILQKAVKRIGRSLRRNKA